MHKSQFAIQMRICNNGTPVRLGGLQTLLGGVDLPHACSTPWLVTCMLKPQDCTLQAKHTSPQAALHPCSRRLTRVGQVMSQRGVPSQVRYL